MSETALNAHSLTELLPAVLAFPVYCATHCQERCAADLWNLVCANDEPEDHIRLSLSCQNPDKDIRAAIRALGYIIHKWRRDHYRKAKGIGVLHLRLPLMNDEKLNDTAEHISRIINQGGGLCEPHFGLWGKRTERSFR